MESINSFEKGMSRSVNERSSDAKTLYDGVNGRLYFDDDGNVVWRPTEGNQQVLVFDGDAPDPDRTVAPFGVDPGQGQNHVPIGGCAFADCLIVVTVRVDGPDTHFVMWNFQFNESNEVYGQVLISDRSYPADNKFFQKIWNNLRMRPLFENEELYRVLWCDGVEDDSQPLRTLTFSDTGSTTNPSYNGSPVNGTFKTFAKLALTTPQLTNNMAPFKQGVMHFQKRIDGSLLSGRYVYLYRLIMEDGYRTPWSHPTNEVFVTTDPIDGNSQANMHLFEMEDSGSASAIGNRLFIKGVDLAYKWIEAAYVYIPDATNVPTDAASFSFTEVVSEEQTVDHISMNGEVLNVNEMISLRLNIKAAQTIEIKDEHQWVGNYRTERLQLSEAEVNAMLGGVEVVHCFREMGLDEKGKTDKAHAALGPRDVLYHIDTVVDTATMSMNQNQDLVLPIESDWATYRGQQVDCSFVGYPRDETERVGILLYDKEGNPGFVYHLCDYKFPKMFDNNASAERIRPDGSIVNVIDAAELALHKKAWLTTGQADPESISDNINYPSILQRPVKDSGSNTDPTEYTDGTNTHLQSFARLMGLKIDGIDVSGISDRISGFAIVRCKTEYTTLAQGIISPCVIHEGDDQIVKPTPRPHMTMRWLVNSTNSGDDVVPTVANNNNFRPQQHQKALWDRANPTYPSSDEPRLRYVKEFATLYIPEVLFDLENLPDYDSNSFLELTQICWEEYNCGLDVAGIPYATDLSIQVNPGYDHSSSGSNHSFDGKGPQLCNMFQRDPRNSGNRWTNTTKTSWHLMFNTRLQDFYDGTGFSLPYKHDIPFNNGDPILQGHPKSAEYNGGGGLPSFRWAYPAEAFPIYGDTIQPEYISLVEMNEKRSGISVQDPTWQFHNHTKYWCPTYEQTSPAVYFNQWIFDDYYGGNQDVALHDTHTDGLSFFSGDDNQREMTGHNNTLLMKYDGEIKRNNVVGPAKFFMCAVIPTWAEMIMGGDSDPVGSAYTCDPNIGAAARWIFNWKRLGADLYGGSNITALQNNIFIGTGHFQPVGNEHFETAVGGLNPPTHVYNDIEIWGGDCWLDAHSGTINYPSFNEEGASGRHNACFAPIPPGFQMPGQNVTLPLHSDGGFVMVFPHESRWNLCLRSAPSAGNPNSASAGLRPQNSYFNNGNHDEWIEGLFRWDGKSGDSPDPSKHYLEEFFINEVLRYDDLFRPWLTIPRGFRAINRYPVRWLYSNRKVYGDIVDSFREFYVNNWRDINGEYGQIMASVFYKDDVYSYQEKAYGKLRIYERSLLNTNTVEQVVTGEGDVISGIRYINQMVGCQHPESLIATPKGMYWVDAFSRSIHLSNGEADANLSDDKGQNQILRQLLWRYVDGRSIYGPKGVAITVGYNPDTNTIEFNFPAQTEDQLTSVTSKRYKEASVTPIAGQAYGFSSWVSYVQFVDKGSEYDEGYKGNGITSIEIQDQDVVVMDWSTNGTQPSAFLFDLYQGLYGTSVTPKKNLTVKEFYIVIPEKAAKGWLAAFRNLKATSADLSTPDKIYPDPTRTHETESYLYDSVSYPNTVPDSIGHESDVAVFHLYRSSQNGVFQVRKMPYLDGDDIYTGMNIRGRLIYNESAEVFEGWETTSSIFNVLHRAKLLTSIENQVEDGLFHATDVVAEEPLLHGQRYISWLTYLVNQVPIANKIFDNARLNVGSKEDVNAIRFNTSEQAIVLFVQNDPRAKYKRNILRLPVRRVSQIDRMRGEYLMVNVEFADSTHKLAYCFTTRTVFRVSHKN